MYTVFGAIECCRNLALTCDRRSLVQDKIPLLVLSTATQLHYYHLPRAPRPERVSKLTTGYFMSLPSPDRSSLVVSFWPLIAAVACVSSGLI